MFCNQCGARIADGSVFCNLCGTRQGVVVPAATPPVNPLPTAPGLPVGFGGWVVPLRLLYRAPLSRAAL